MAKPPSRVSRHVGFKRFLLGLAFVVLMITLTPLVAISIVGPHLMVGLTPRFANTTSKMDRIAPLRAWKVAVDTSITPARAGEALVSLAYRNGRRHPVIMPPTRVLPAFPKLEKDVFPPAALSGGWTGPAPEKIMGIARSGVTPAQRAYLAELAANPIWEEFSTLARAARLDASTAMYVVPFPSNASAFELPILPFAGTKELAYANAARAAWYIIDRKPAEAEQALRETISVGFKLVDDGNMLIDQLIGVVMVGLGRDQLAEFYQHTNAADAAKLAAAARDTAQRATTPVVVDTREQLLAAMADSTLPRGLRFDLVSSASLSTCTNVREVLFGARAPLRDAIAIARNSLVRSDSDGALFDLTARLVTGTPPAPTRSRENSFGRKLLNSTARISSTVLMQPRIAYCASLGAEIQ